MSESRLASYDAETLALTGVVQTSGACQSETSAFNIQSMQEPFYVYSVSYGNGCGMSISIDPADGSLQEVEKSWSYGEESSIHGMGLNYIQASADAAETEILYAADINGDIIWSHETDTRGGLSSLRAQTKVPGRGGVAAKPRHLAVHPNGKVMYVMLEATNELTSLEIDDEGVPVEAVEASNFRLIPDGKPLLFNCSGLALRCSSLWSRP